MRETLGMSTTPTSGSTATEPIAPGKSGNTPVGHTVGHKEAALNLVAAIVRRAVLDAHPQSPVPEEIKPRLDRHRWPEMRKEAEMWVRDLFKDKPSNLTWAEDLWRMSYRKASIAVEDRRFLIRGTWRMSESFKRSRARFVEERRKQIPDGWVQTKTAASMIGVTESALRGWAHAGRGPKSMRLRIRGSNLFIFELASVEQWINDNPMYSAKRMWSENGRKTGRTNAKDWGTLIYGKTTEGKNGTDTGR